jgi:hypothetical protein
VSLEFADKRTILTTINSLRDDHMLLVVFVLPVLILLISQTAMWRFLINRGVKVPFVLAGTPGYLDRLFLNWCADNNRSFAWVVVVRALAIITIIGSAFSTDWTN